MARVLLFDVNETLLDLRVLDPIFERAFGNETVRREWFGLVLRNAMMLTMIGDHRDFLAVGVASLDMLASQHQVSLRQSDRDAIRQTMSSLPPHDDVVANLERLHEAGYRMAALTNSPPEAAQRQLDHAGIAPFMEKIMSVEAVGRFKPAREVYEMAASELGISTPQMRMVAAHDWDVAGAMAAGCAGALLLRPGAALNPLVRTPDIVERDFHRLTERILEVEAR